MDATLAEAEDEMAAGQQGATKEGVISEEVTQVATIEVIFSVTNMDVRVVEVEGTLEEEEAN